MKRQGIEVRRGLLIGFVSLILLARCWAEPAFLVIIDTGVEHTHPAFEGAFSTSDLPRELPAPLHSPAQGPWLGWDFVEADGLPQDRDGHGSHLAGIAWEACRNGTRDGARLLIFRSGEKRHELSTINAALQAVIALQTAGYRVPVVLCAFEFLPEDENADEVASFRALIEKLVAAEVAVVAPAGNLGMDLEVQAEGKAPQPGAMGNVGVFTAAACSEDGHLVLRSNWGSERVLLAVPGVRVKGPQLGGGYRHLSGSSQAAARLAGWLMQARMLDPDASLASLEKMLGQVVIRHPSLTGRTRLGAYLKSKPPASPEAKSETESGP